MESKIILRFRDLNVEKDGTINDHKGLINQFGEVWWGWWMKQDETPPHQIFKQLAKEIETNNYASIYLYNTGLAKFYECICTKILVAPINNTIGTPNPETSPSYYHRGSYPAWFLLNRIEETDFKSLNFYFEDFPTGNKLEEPYKNNLGQPIEYLEILKSFDVTFWLVKMQ